MEVIFWWHVCLRKVRVDAMRHGHVIAGRQDPLTRDPRRHRQPFKLEQKTNYLKTCSGEMCDSKSEVGSNMVSNHKDDKLQ
jgi:hypothetical protein